MMMKTWINHWFFYPRRFSVVKVIIFCPWSYFLSLFQNWLLCHHQPLRLTWHPGWPSKYFLRKRSVPKISKRKKLKRVQQMIWKRTAKKRGNNIWYISKSPPLRLTWHQELMAVDKLSIQKFPKYVKSIQSKRVIQILFSFMIRWEGCWRKSPNLDSNQAHRMVAKISWK